MRRSCLVHFPVACRSMLGVVSGMPSPTWHRGRIGVSRRQLQCSAVSQGYFPATCCSELSVVSSRKPP